MGPKQRCKLNWKRNKSANIFICRFHMVLTSINNLWSRSNYFLYILASQGTAILVCFVHANKEQKKHGWIHKTFKRHWCHIPALFMMPQLTQTISHHDCSHGYVLTIFKHWFWTTQTNWKTVFSHDRSHDTTLPGIPLNCGWTVESLYGRS